MVKKIVMPRLSLTMKEGMVGMWYKKEGDTVEKNEPVAEVVSEKATYDLESPASGILRKIFVKEGCEVSVNAVLAVISAPDEPFSEEEVFVESPRAAETEGERRVLASPAAKRVAKEHGIDLSTVKGSGLEGRITEEDVKQLAKKRTRPLPRIKKTVPLHGFRKTSAERVSTSFKTVPHSAIMMEVDMSNAEELHKRINVSYTAIIAKIVADSLEELPWINSTFEDAEIKIFEDVNIGIAVTTEHGLVVPVINDCNRKTFSEVAIAIEKLMEKARQEKLSIGDLSQGTFTVTNLGMHGVAFFTPIINPPEAAILGVGRIVEKPVVISGKIEIKPMLMLSLSYDHRIVDGAPAAEFLQRVKMKLEGNLT